VDERARFRGKALKDIKLHPEIKFDTPSEPSSGWLSLGEARPPLPSSGSSTIPASRCG
jgi:hypothetical protein